LTVYRRLFPVGNEFSGVIVMNIARSHFDALIARAALFKGQEIYLLDRDGRLILDNVGGSGSTSALPASLLSREVKALTREKHRGSSYYVYSSRTSRYDWRVVSRIPASSLNSLPIAVRNLILAMLALSLVIGAVLALRAARRNSRRIASIVGLFEKADAGEAVLENTTLAHDEYDQMVETLIRTFLRNRYASLRLSERQAQAQVLELKALRAQMNPHFLFNTLESLYWMVFGTEGLPSPASAMILDLSKLLKYSLEDSEEVALADEIGQAKRYLAIQGFRYKDKFETSWDIEEEALRCRVVKFFLQPLLENAISHGIRNAEGRRSLFVQAELDRSGQALRIRVRDDGVGMDAERLAALRASLLEAEHPSDHIGLYNTNRHIQLVFGESAGLSIESEAGIGTLVEAHFPLTLAVP
jgi:two-component system, sensor histidine kinase YesM